MKPATPLPETRKEFYARLRANKAEEARRALAYPELVAALREAYSTVRPGMPVEDRVKLARIGDLLAKLGESA